MTHQVEPTTYAYLAGGCFMATSFGAAVEAAEELGLSQVDLLQGVTEMATTIETLYLHVGAKFDGCFAYDVAEKLGAWYSDYVALHRQLPTPDQIKVEGCRLLAIEPPSDDAMALDRIQYLLSGQEWNDDHLNAVAVIVRGTGREIKDCDDTVDDAA